MMKKSSEVSILGKAVVNSQCAKEFSSTVDIRYCLLTIGVSTYSIVSGTKFMMNFLNDQITNCDNKNFRKWKHTCVSNFINTGKHDSPEVTIFTLLREVSAA